MQKAVEFISIVIFCLFLTITLGCEKKEPPKMDPHKEPVSGMIDFVSADPDNAASPGEFQASIEAMDDAMAAIAPEMPVSEPTMAAPESVESSAVSTATVEEGDIYRVLGNQLIANLNQYRGLQLIDVSNVSAPFVAGSLRISASPVEMYARGRYAYLLMNYWQGYSGNQDDLKVESYNGGVVLAVDISDPATPQIVTRLDVPGNIRNSRMVQVGDDAALYIASNQYSSGSETIVQGFTLGENGAVSLQSTINLGGYVQDIQATPEAMLVAREDWQDDKNINILAILDISNPNGTIVQGADIPIAGRIFHKSNMDLYSGILRVVSGSQWRTTETNHLQTFDVTDINEPKPIDHDEFGEGEQLEATVFLGNKAFFVTYFRTDPFHAFEIDDDGNAEEKMEYVISGWNDFFRPVSDGTRLIGIGVNDEFRSTMAVSLYDISDLSNPDPFIDRSEVAMDNSWSEANWDDRAFSVLENVVSVLSEDGTEETGLVLLPFQGYKQNVGRKAGVQIYTFSDQTLTVRGVMEQNNPVRRSFLAQPEAVANLSEAELSLFDHTDPDEPFELSRLNLAPNFSDFMIFGTYGVRVKPYTGNYYAPEISETLPVNTLEVIELNQDPERADAVATLEVPVGARIYHVNHLIVTVETTLIEDDMLAAYLQVYDLSDPEKPRKAGSLTTDRIVSGNNRPFLDFMPMDVEPTLFGLIPPIYRYGNSAFEMEDSLVFVSIRQENELVGEEYVCQTSFQRCSSSFVGPLPPVVEPDDLAEIEDEADEEASEERTDDPPVTPVTESYEKIDEWYGGSITCRNLEGEEPVCTGRINKCERYEDNCVVCNEVDPATAGNPDCYRRSCDIRDRYNVYNIVTLDILDLSDPDNPELSDRIEMPKEEQNIGMLAESNTLYYNYKVPYTVDGDTKTYSKYYFKSIDLSNPSQPDVSPGINIPGRLLKVDGNDVYTHDSFWKDDTIESSLNKLSVSDGQAELEGRHSFTGQNILKIMLDDQGQALVSHREIPSPVEQTCPPTPRENTQSISYLSILDTGEEDLPVIGKFEIDRWANMRDTQAGRILFSIPGGLLLVNIEEAASPFAQAFFPVQSWPNEFAMHDMKITFAAGRFGIYQFGLEENNLD